MQKRWLIRTISLLLSLLIISACGVLVDGENNGAQAEPTVTPIPTAPAAAKPTYIVQRGTVQESLIFSGRWLPRDQQELSFEIAGTIRTVNVRRNDTVTTGTLLADFQIDSLEDQLASARLSLQTALTNLDSNDDSAGDSVTNAQFTLADANVNLQSTVDNAPWTNVVSARQSLETARVNLENAERDYSNALGDPSAGPSTVDNAYNAVQSAEANIVSAQTSYWSAAQTYNNYQYSITNAENSVLQQEVNLESAITGGGNASQIQSVNEAQLNIDQILGDIAQSSLYAPIDGVVLEVNVSPGNATAAFDTVMTIAIPEPLEVIANLAFNDTQRLSVGMIGKCELMNQPDTAVQCVIRQVPLSNRDADQTVRVAASLDNIPSGQLVEVEMPLDVRDNVLWLPPEAIRTFQNRTFVVVQTADGERVVDISIGLQTDDRVEVETGLSENDIIVGQ
jgi:multidrug resistance efflux pump